MAKEILKKILLEGNEIIIPTIADLNVVWCNVEDYYGPEYRPYQENTLYVVYDQETLHKITLGEKTIWYRYKPEISGKVELPIPEGGSINFGFGGDIIPDPITGEFKVSPGVEFSNAKEVRVTTKGGLVIEDLKISGGHFQVTIRNDHTKKKFDLSECDLSVKETRIDSSDETSNYSFFNTDIEEIDMSGLIVSPTGCLAGLFNYCKKLKKVDLSNFRLSYGGDFRNMFDRCESLTEIDLSKLDISGTPGPTGYMFNKCNNLQRINLSNLSEFNVEQSTFFSCRSLQYLLVKPGSIKKYIDLRYSPIVKGSLSSIIEGLCEVTKEYLNIRTMTYDFLTEEDIAVITSKGWTIVSQNL